MTHVQADTPDWLARYNDFHAPAGLSTGGQFSAGGSSKSVAQ